MIAAADILVLRHRVDWAGIIADLNAAGVSGYRLANILGLDWPTVRHWRDGGEPTHSRGVALLEVHTRFCGRENTTARLDSAQIVL
jgi:hypothetical protein